MKYSEKLETDDISELASYIERWYPTEEIRIHDTETIHFAYWDKSQRSVYPEFLEHIQQAGYRILHAGKATVPKWGTPRAWVECRKHASEDKVIVTANESDVYTKGDVYRVTCEHCDEGYLPDEAGSITIRGPGDVRYTCPRCGHGTNGPSPLINED